jgi:hypothetical protein
MLVFVALIPLQFIGPFRELKIRLFDRFGFVANQTRIRLVLVKLGPPSKSKVEEVVRRRLTV